MPTAATIEEIDFAPVKQVKFKGQSIKRVLNGTVVLWPDPWEDVWSDVPIGS